MKKFLSNNRGGIALVVLGFFMFLLILSGVVIEALRWYQSYYTLETAIQRSLTAAVEQNLSYAWQADGCQFLYMWDTLDESDWVNEKDANVRGGQGAWYDFNEILCEQLGVGYSKPDSMSATWTELDDEGELLFRIDIQFGNGTVCEDYSEAQLTQMVAGTYCSYTGAVFDNPFLTVSGTITVKPVFGGWLGEDTKSFDFEYTSKNFIIHEKEENIFDNESSGGADAPFWAEG